ncbi:hypothetical protein [Thalassotalea sp. PS06]|uniref:hypothetical protein n=1 Tax=Thalassotalea sp. PS06 TaxID=2594005 RepID=UPI001C8F6BAD|nr:hypothetical protein [Thalassotalea sp. PS06]
MSGLLGAMLSLEALALDRGVLASDFLYEKGSFFEASTITVDPDVTGIVTSSPKAFLINSGIPAFQPIAEILPDVGQSTGSVVNEHSRYTFSFKTDISDTLVFGYRFSEPSGNDINYADEVLGYNIDIEANAHDFLLKYKFNDEISIFGGIRAQHTGSGTLGYNIAGQFNVGADDKFGHILGFGIQNPEIKTRILFTFTSGIDHIMKGQGVEGTGIAVRGEPVSLATATKNAELYYSTPDHIHFSLRQPISLTSAIFASYRFSNWKDSQLKSNISGFETITKMINIEQFTVGYGRKLNDHFSLSAGFSHQTGRASLYNPVNDRFALNIGARVSFGDLKVNLNYVHVELEDGETEISLGGLGAIGMEFKGNSARVLSARMSYSF